VPQRQIGRSGIHPELNSQRLAALGVVRKFSAKIILAQNAFAPAGEKSELLIDI
jgi:hypothetical protein